MQAKITIRIPRGHSIRDARRACRIHLGVDPEVIVEEAIKDSFREINKEPRGTFRPHLKRL
jgi:hypothetical protein